jgi:hypothetical protein
VLLYSHSVLTDDVAEERDFSLKELALVWVGVVAFLLQPL